MTARDRQAGVSLVEVLVVLAIIGIVAGAGLLGLGLAGREARAEAEARRLADRLRLAADEVLVTGIPRALVWDAAGYRFMEWDADAEAWRPDRRATLGRAHALPAGLRLEPGAGGEHAPVVIPADLALRTVSLRIGGAAPPAWQVAFDGLAVAAGPVGP